ncbi:MAG: AAA family ATPase, partial [Sphingomonas sp.]|nr:AAA family ATPase [Sphingomonas sp.]
MSQIGLSEGAAAVAPALASWLAGVGLGTTRIVADAAAPKDMIRIIAAS